MKLNRYLKILTAIFFTTAFLPGLAAADLPSDLKVFVTHGDFDAMANAFLKLALIMSDTGYKGLFMAFTGLIAFGTGAGMIGAGILGAKKTEAAQWVSWGGTLVVGIMLWAAFILPTTNFTIYDKYRNTTKTIPGVPYGVAAIAGLFSVVEEGLMQIIDTTSIDHSFSEEQNAITFKILEKAFTGDVDLAGTGNDGAYNTTSINKYIKDCFLFELQREGTSLKLDDLYINSDFQTLLSQGQNPAKWTMVYSDANPGGLPMSCTSAWGAISSFLNGITDVSPANNRFWSERCALAGIDDLTSGATGSPALTMCQSKAADMIGSGILGSSLASSTIFKQYLIASELYKAATEMDPDSSILTTGNHSKGTSLISGGILSSEWMPYLKSMMYAAFIGMLPFLGIFLSTPIYKKVITFAIGMFVFFITWSVCRNILGQLAMDQALSLMSEIRNGQLGLKSMLLFEGAAAKAYATFGNYEGLAFTMAGTFSAIFVKTGSTGMTRFGQTATADYARAGANAGQNTSVGDPTRRTSTQEGLTKSVAVEAIHNGNAMGTFSANEMAKQVREFDTMKLARADYGNGIGDGDATGRTLASANQLKNWMTVSAAKAVHENALSRGMDPERAMESMQHYSYNSKTGEALAFDKMTQELKKENPGWSHDLTMDFMKDIQAQSGFGNAKGLNDGFQNAKQNLGFAGNLSNYVEMQKELEANKGFFNADTAHGMADKYFDGDVNKFLRGQSEYTLASSASMLSNMEKGGGSVESIMGAVGMAKAASHMAQSDVAEKTGLQGQLQLASNQLWEGVAKHTSRAAMNDIVTNGTMSSGTAKLWDTLANDENGSAQLRAMGMQNVVVGDMAQAENLASFLNSNGHKVQAEALSGAAVGLNLFSDQDGAMKTGYVSSKEGTVVTSQNMAHNQEYLSAEEAQNITGQKHAPEGMYNIYSNPDGSGAMLVEGKSGFTHQSSDLQMVTTSDGGHSVKYIDPDTGEASYHQLKSGYAISEEAVEKKDIGPQLTSGSVRSMALDGKKETSVGSYLFDKDLTNAARETRAQAVQTAYAGDLDKYATKSGGVSSHWGVDAGGQLVFRGGTPLEDIIGSGVKASASTSMGAGMKVTESDNHNLNMVEAGLAYTKAQEYGAKMGKEKGIGFDHEAASHYYDNNLKANFSEKATEYDGTVVRPDQFGLDAPYGNFKDIVSQVQEGMGVKDMKSSH